MVNNDMHEDYIISRTFYIRTAGEQDTHLIATNAKSGEERRTNKTCKNKQQKATRI